MGETDRRSDGRGEADVANGTGAPATAGMPGTDVPGTGAPTTLLRRVALGIASDAEGLPRADDETRDVLLRDGRVARIAAPGTIDAPPGAGTIDGAGLVALPGFTDLYGRLREPGPSRRGTLASETRAALAGGFTTVLCAPDTDPVIDSTATLELIRRRAALAPAARVAPIAALTKGLDGRELAELATLAAAGAVAAGQADRPIEHTGVLRSAMRYAASFDLPLIMRAQDAHLGAGGCAHEGAVATRLGLPGISVTAETVALARLLELCRDTGCRLHVSRLSTARGVAMLADAKREGLPVTADVGIHHLFFTDHAIAGFDARFRSAVPFRGTEDRAALREGLAEGTIDAICSDHAPEDSDARLAPFAACAPGLSAYDRFLPLLLALPRVGGVPLGRVLDAVTGGPGRVLGFGGNGRDDARNIEPSGAGGTDGPTPRFADGDPADLVLVDPAAADARTPISAGRNTPIQGVDDLGAVSDEEGPLAGAARWTFVGGERRHGS